MKLGKRKPSGNRKKPDHNSSQISRVERPSACYIYGIVNTGSRLTLKARSNNPSESSIYTIRYRDIAALVSRTDFKEYDPTEENLLAHNNVVQEAMDRLGCAVTPTRFSTIARSEDDVVRILSAGYSSFKEKLSSLEGKLEIAIKVFCDTEALKQEVSSKDKPCASSDIHEEVRQRAHWLASRLLEQLRTASEQYHLNDIVFEDMIMNGAFLVRREGVQKFFEEVKCFDKQYGKNLRIQCSGPYVPYSFIEPPGVE